MKVLIDNGHGENTKGKRSPDGKLREYAWTREIADMLVLELGKMGIDAERVVKETIDVPLSERCRRVNEICGIHSRAAQEVLGDDGCRGCRDRGTRNAQRGRNDSQTQRTLGPNLIGLGYLADDGQQRIAGMGRTRHQAKKPGAERTIIGDMVRMLAQEDRRLSDEIFQSARSL